MEGADGTKRGERMGEKLMRGMSESFERSCCIQQGEMVCEGSKSSSVKCETFAMKEELC